MEEPLALMRLGQPVDEGRALPHVVQGIAVRAAVPPVAAPPAAASMTTGLLANSFAAGSITGIRIRVHPLLPATTLLYSLGYVLTYGTVGFALGLLVFGPLLWSTVLFHELWHCWAAKRLGIRVDEILLWPLGGLAFIGQSPTPCADISVAAAGPASHLPQALLWIGLLAAANGGSLADLAVDPRSNFGGAVCYLTLLLNASMALFNLCLPCYPLDGGRILADALLARGLSPTRAAGVLVRISALVALGLLAYAAFLLVEQAGTGQASVPAHALVLCALVAWMGAQTYSLHALQRDGRAHMHPLFASAAGAAPRADEAPAMIRADAAVTQRI